MEYQDLTCPQLLSEDVLRMILRDKCIQVHDFESMDKPKLIELYIRVAMPMPQRKYHANRCLGQKMHGLRVSRDIAIADYANNCDISSAATTKCLDNPKNFTDMPLKTTIKNSPAQLDKFDREMKRKCSQEVELLSPTAKRQKITWP